MRPGNQDTLEGAQVLESRIHPGGWECNQQFAFIKYPAQQTGIISARQRAFRCAHKFTLTVSVKRGQAGLDPD